LHKDIFYIADPTLAFVGLPYYTSTFTLFEFQAMALAAVFAGRASLPSVDAMRAEYRAKLLAKGCGRAFHSLKGVQVAYVDDLLGWVNADAEARGWRRLEGHTEQWRRDRAEFDAFIRERLGMKDQGAGGREVG
jgi:hypothetical protein